MFSCALVAVTAVAVTAPAAAAAPEDSAGPAVIYRDADTNSVRVQTLDGLRITTIPQLTPMYFTWDSWSMSPDGTALVYVEDGEQRLLEHDGSRRQVGPDGVGVPTSWSPDGRQLLFNVHSGLYKAPRDGSQGRLLSEGVEVVAQAWNPVDPDLIVGMRVDTESSDYRRDVVVVDATSGEVRTVVEVDGVTYPSWADDGDHVIYRDPQDQNNRYRINVHDAAAEPQLVFATNDEWWITSADGRYGTRWDERVVVDPIRGERTVYDLLHRDGNTGGTEVIYSGRSEQDTVVHVPGYGADDPRVLVLLRSQAPSDPRSLIAIDPVTKRSHQLTAGGREWAHTRVENIAEGWFPSTPTARTIDRGCPAQWGNSSSYPDVPNGSVHGRTVGCIARWDVTQGRPDGTYDPRGTVTRAQMASFVARMIEASGGVLPSSNRSRFSDVSGPHAENIDKLAEAGIVRGTGARTYSPNSTVTRAQMATFLANAVAYRTGAPVVADRAYFPGLTGPHAANIQAAAYAGITGGTAAGGYEPNGPVRRDQMASFIARTLDVFVTGGHAQAP